VSDQLEWLNPQVLAAGVRVGSLAREAEHKMPMKKKTTRINGKS